MREIQNIIEALSRHEDSSSVAVLERLGTNSENSEIRSLTAEALAKRNTHEAIKILVLNKGKGINDLDEKVAERTINALLSIKEKTEVMKVLEDTMNLHSDEEVRETARSIRELLSLSI